MTNWVKIFTDFVFYAYVGIHQVFDNYQRCPVPLTMDSSNICKFYSHQYWRSSFVQRYFHRNYLDKSAKFECTCMKTEEHSLEKVWMKDLIFMTFVLFTIWNGPLVLYFLNSQFRRRPLLWPFWPSERSQILWSALRLLLCWYMYVIVSNTNRSATTMV